ncbi:Auxin-responsive protein SAUR50 [Camellia lanceoleosa]|uniref:Auxin-responsive protein SAUR50 n=1 Tax=Camellia lanceoleosa TaxID=1840588 RepID=A0ACC0G7S1_9ERIC|nr:Auxin-responsive protein SAUR50 [Camellia lanceoleosa]
MKMKIMMKAKFLKVCINKWQQMGSRVMPSTASCDCCLQWGLWPSMQEKKSVIPRDVPKGHLVVYVGEDYKRYVINITLLNHPLFKALLDQAKEEYDFTAASKLCIPCDENIFLTVLRCAAYPQNRRLSLCL